MQGLNVTEADLVVYVHPSQSKNVSQAILRELSSLLFKFNETFGGVVLAYSVNTPAKVARILSGVHSYFGVRRKAELLLFSPKPEMQLEGKVVKVTRESIHAIILGFSSAIVTDKEIRDEFRYKRKHGEGLYVSRSDKHHVIKVGTVIRFIVKRLDEEVMLISGSLIPAHTGSVKWLDGHRNSSTTHRVSTGDYSDHSQMVSTLKDETVDNGNSFHPQRSEKRPQSDGEVETPDQMNKSKKHKKL